MQNGHIDSFNVRLRDEFLNVSQFFPFADVREQIERSRIDYNAHRRHSSLGNLAPSEFAKQRQANRPFTVAEISLLAVYKRDQRHCQGHFEAVLCQVHTYGRSMHGGLLMLSFQRKLNHHLGTLMLYC